MRPEMYIVRPHVHTHTARSLGRAAAASPRSVERRRRRRRLDDRQRNLPHARGDRAARGRCAAVPPELGAGWCGDAVRGAHVCRARGAVPALGRHLRLHPRGVRAAPRLSLRVGGAVDHPPGRLRRDLDHVRGVHAAGPRARSGRDGGDRGGPGSARRTAPGRALRPARCRRELRRHPPRRDRTEREYGVESRGSRPAGRARLRTGRGTGARRRSDARAARAGGLVALPARDGGDPVGVRRVGRSRVRRRGGEGSAAQPAAGDVHWNGVRGRPVPRGQPGVPAPHPHPAGAGRGARRGRCGPDLVGRRGADRRLGGGAVSTFGTLNGSMMTAPRIFFAMAEDGVFPKAITRVDPRTGAPTGAIVLAGCLGALFVLVRRFTELADQFIIGIWPFYALAVAAGFVLRRRRPDLERGYRTWGYPVVPLVFLLGAVFLLGNYLVSETPAFALDVGIILSGIPAYYIWLRYRTAPMR